MALPFGALGRDGQVLRLFEDADESRSVTGTRFEETLCKSALNHVPGGFLPFDWTVNPYRGCAHACPYCYARPSHEYLGLGPGEDFERRIIVKTNVADVLRRELAHGRNRGETVALGSNTDPYQRAERLYGLTRAILEVLRDFRNPVSVTTKSPAVAEDGDLLGELVRGLGHLTGGAGASGSRVAGASGSRGVGSSKPRVADASGLRAARAPGSRAAALLSRAVDSADTPEVSSSGTSASGASGPGLGVSVNLSVGSVDREVWRLLEPASPRPDKRLAAVRRLNELGVPTGILMAPVVPFISDGPDQLAATVAAAARAGARWVVPMVMNLRPGVKELFIAWLKRERPDLLRAYDALYGSRAYPKHAYRVEISRRVARLRAEHGIAAAGGHGSFRARSRDGA